MTDNPYDAWFSTGAKFLAEWDDYIIGLGGSPLSSNEQSAYMLACEQAGREAGVIE